MANRDDQNLIRCTLAGQQEAFGQLVCKYQDRLYNGLVQILRSEADAEDAVQDAFVLAFTKLDSFQGKSAFFTWLYRIGYNVAISRIRRRKQTVSLSGDGERQFDFESDGPAPADRMEQDEDSRQLTAALDRLSDDHRSILVLREMEEMDYDAISEVLDLPIGTVRSRLHRARSALREELESMTNRS
jgi:RNA polymerase sigma-70 factor (ECF subfamily)